MVSNVIALEDTGAVVEEVQPILVQTGADTQAPLDFEGESQADPAALGGLKLNFIKPKPKPTKAELKAEELKDAHLPIPMSAILNEAPKKEEKKKPKIDKVQLQKEAVDSMVDSMVAQLPHADTAAAMGASGEAAETSLLEMSGFTSNPYKTLSEQSEKDDIDESTSMLKRHLKVASKAKQAWVQEQARRKKNTETYHNLLHKVNDFADEDKEEGILLEEEIPPPAKLSKAVQKKMAKVYRKHKQAEKTLKADKAISKEMKAGLERRANRLATQKRRMQKSLLLGFTGKKPLNVHHKPPKMPVKKHSAAKADLDLLTTHIPPSKTSEQRIKEFLAPKTQKEKEKKEKKPTAQKKKKPVQMVAHHFFSTTKEADAPLKPTDESVSASVEELLNPKPVEEKHNVGTDIFAMTMESLLPADDASAVQWAPGLRERREAAQKKLKEVISQKSMMPPPVVKVAVKKQAVAHKSKISANPTPMELFANLKRAGMTAQAKTLKAAIVRSSAKAKKLLFETRKARYLKFLHRQHVKPIHKFTTHKVPQMTLPAMPPPVVKKTAVKKAIVKKAVAKQGVVNKAVVKKAVVKKTKSDKAIRTQKLVAKLRAANMMKEADEVLRLANAAT